MYAIYITQARIMYLVNER